MSSHARRFNAQRSIVLSACLCGGLGGFLATSLHAEPTATSGWSSETTPEKPHIAPNPVLCQSFEKGVMERIALMRKLRFGSAKPPPLMPDSVNQWQRETQMDPDAFKKYASEEAMVKRLNGYMVDNGCTPVDVQKELVAKPSATNTKK